MRRAVRIEVKGNSLCTSCGGTGWFVVCEDERRGNPAYEGVEFCPFCGARFELLHVDNEAEDLDEYESVADR